jgi:GxxExxY protein
MRQIRRTFVESGDTRDPETYAIIGAAMEVHRVLGRWFLEPVYQEALSLELRSRGIPHEREVHLPIRYKGITLGRRYRADFVCFGEVLLELKALERLTPAEESQVISYLAACGLGRALLLNFGSGSLQFKRFVGPALLAIPSVSSV